MSAADQTQTVKVKVEGDTASARAAMQALAQETKKTKSAFDTMREGFNKNADSILSGLGKLNQALEGVGKIVDGIVAGAAFAKLSAEMKNLEKNVPVGMLGKLQNATDGAVTKIDLMRFSMKALHGEMALTKEGLVTVMKAADTLSDQGFGDTIQIAEKLTDALRTGNVKGLKEFGIQLDITGDKQKDVNQAMQKMHDLAETTVDVNPQLQAIERLQTATQDWVNDMKMGLGDFFNWAFDGFDQLTDAIAGVQSRQKYMSNSDIENEAYKASVAAGGYGAGGGVADEAVYNETKARLLAARKSHMDADSTRSARRQTQRIINGLRGGDSESARRRGTSLITGTHKGKGDASGGPVDYADYVVPEYADLGAPEYASDKIGPEKVDMSGENADASQLYDDQARAALEDQARIMKELADVTTAAGAAYDVFGAAISGAVDAALEGNKSLGAAALAAAAASLKGIAKTSTIKALEQTALGFEYLASVNPLVEAKAPAAFAAAGKYALTAIAAGVAGAGLSAAGGAGGGGGSAHASPGSSPGGGFAGGSSSSNGNGPVTYIINIGDGAYVGDRQELGEVMIDRIRSAERSGRSRPASGVVKLES